MKTCKNLTVLVLTVLLLASCMSSPAVKDTAQPAEQGGTEETAPYLLGPADQITINVWRNSDLTRNITIDPAGRITMPLAGEIKAAGLSVPELKQKIEENLKKYMINPQVDVTVVSIKSAKVYILGEVKMPGSYAMDHNVMPLEAIALAGGFSSSANQDKVLLVRNQQGKAEVTAMNLNMRSRSGRKSLTTVKNLRSGDIVYVIPTKVSDLDVFMSHIKNILSPFVTAEQGIVLWPQVLDVVKNQTTATENKTTIAITP